MTARRPGRARRRPRDVVVVGASLAGLFAAAAAQRAGCAVTVLERDVVPPGARSRAGVPQGEQPHVFLYRGLLAAEHLLPGLRGDLLAAGAVPFDTGDLAWLGETGWAAGGHRELEILSATRPLFEHVVRSRVLALPGVGLRDGVRVAALERDDAEQGGRDAGWQVVPADGPRLRADLVVDASGRGSRLPVWLDALGIGPARVSEVDNRVGYATRSYRPAAGTPLPAGVVVQLTPGDLTGGIALPVEQGRWLVGSLGVGDHRPGRDPASFAASLRALRDPVLADLVAAAEPDGEVRVHRQTGNRRHHYERLRDWPAGLLVVGDALCAFDPVYGQGVTVAACEAELLARALNRGLRAGDERRLLRRFAALTSVPWAIATSEDLRYPTSSGSPTVWQSVLGGWSRRLGRLSTHGDHRVQVALARVYHLVSPPVTLFHPALVTAVVRARLLGEGPPTPRPDVPAHSTSRVPRG